MNSIVLPPSNKRKASFIVSTTIEVAGESSYFFLKGRFFPAYFVILSLVFFVYSRGRGQDLSVQMFGAFLPIVFWTKRTTPRERQKELYFFILQKNCVLTTWHSLCYSAKLLFTAGDISFFVA